MRMNVYLAIIIAILLTANFADNCFSQNAMRIKPDPDHPGYWSYLGEPVMLLGGSDDDNLFQLPELESQLDLLASVGGNYIRNTMSARLDKGHEVQPFLQLENGKYDLDQWNPEYWQRFENLIHWCEEREIIIQIEIWDRFDYTGSGEYKHWDTTAYNPTLNINYSYEESGFAEQYPDHPSRDLHPFFHTIPGTRNYQEKYDVIRHYQEEYVDKMLSHSLHHGNVLYCMDNETSTPRAWGLYWMSHIRRRAEEEGVDVYVTDMFDHAFRPWDCPDLLAAIDAPDEYDFLDVSQNNSRNFNEDHWDVLQWIRNRAKDQPTRPLNNTKVYGSGYFSFGTGGPLDGVERFFRNTLGGCASVRFHRPPAGNGLGEMGQASIQAARTLTDLVPPWEVEPRNDMLGDREPDEAYLAAKPGELYALYFPVGGSVLLDLSGVEGTFDVQWIDVSTGAACPLVSIEADDFVAISPPGEEGFVAAITLKGQ
jgi:hypothetical protein